MPISYFMKTTLLLVAMVLSLHLGQAADPSSWPISYQGNVEPAEEGSVTINGEKKGSFEKPVKPNYRAEVGDSGLELEFNGSGTFTLEDLGIPVDFSEGFTLECRFRLEETVNQLSPPANNASAMIIQASESVGTNRGMWILGFYTDIDDAKNYVVLEGNKSTKPFEIGKDFHVFRVTVKDNEVVLYVDNELVGHVSPRKGASSSGVRFGNLRGSDHKGSAVMDYLKIDPQSALVPQ